MLKPNLKLGTYLQKGGNFGRPKYGRDIVAEVFKSVIVWHDVHEDGRKKIQRNTVSITSL